MSEILLCLLLLCVFLENLEVIGGVVILVGIFGLDCGFFGRVGFLGILGMSVGLNGGELVCLFIFLIVVFKLNN